MPPDADEDGSDEGAALEEEPTLDVPPAAPKGFPPADVCDEGAGGNFVNVPCRSVTRWDAYAPGEEDDAPDVPRLSSTRSRNTGLLLFDDEDCDAVPLAELT